ncbi:MAG: hypothetical protein WD176_04215, partial [Pirellulales bacterium]
MLAAVFVVGCSSSSETAPEKAAAVGGATPAEETGNVAEPVVDKPFRLGDLVEPFDAPPLAELDKTAEWIDRPVLDGSEILREQQAASGPPPVTVAEALALRNDSPENNEKIKATLGRLAPADGAGIG